MPSKYLILAAGIFVASTSCRTSRQEAPPGTTRIAKNLWQDAQPLTNEAYWEYLGWLILRYGRFSPEFSAAFPDTTGAAPEVAASLADSDTMLQHKTYFVPKDQFGWPLAAITYAQLAAYAEWRTNVVYGNILVRKKLLDPGVFNSPTSRFSIEQYMAGGFTGRKPDPGILPAIPIYFLESAALEDLKSRPNARIEPGPRLFCRYVPAKDY